jgi:hypothetical protein
MSVGITNRKISELVEQRNRIGKPILTAAERLDMLERLYDAALFWLRHLVIDGKTKGTGAATLVLEKTRIEMESLRRSTAGYKDEQRLIIDFELPPVTTTQ